MRSRIQDYYLNMEASKQVRGRLKEKRVTSVSRRGGQRTSLSATPRLPLPLPP